MTKIEVSCPGCLRVITINIKTIDDLKSALDSMTKERDYYKTKAAALELKDKTRPIEDLFGSIFK